MSGIVGMVNLDGAPVDRRLLERMTDSLAFRGTDSQNIWIEGNVGFGHTLLKTTFEAEYEHQPFTLDGTVWIVADARIDAQAKLLEELKQQGDARNALDCGRASYRFENREPAPGFDAGQAKATASRSHSESGSFATALQGASGAAGQATTAKAGQTAPPSTDVELILRAYHAWGENCVEHLLGDFAFAIWDGREKRLFCARDHLGVKPFYYAHMGSVVVLSNTLDCVRLHPAVSGKLNDATIGDFLLAGFNPVPNTTTFAEIQRLPAGHAGTWSDGARLRSYWTLPIDDPLVLPRSGDYVERCRGLLRQAVHDRLRTNRLALYMSGGLDSPGLASTARDLLREHSLSRPLKAFTAVYDQSIPDQERHYAGLVAAHLDIPIEFSACDDQILSPWERSPVIATPEPVGDPFAQFAGLASHQRLAAHSRVAFFGEGPDNALACDWRSWLEYLSKNRHYPRLLPGLLRHIFGHPRIPFVGRLRHWLQGYREVDFPGWINPEFEVRLRLRERWGALQATPALVHPTRPTGYNSMSDSLWQDLLEGFDVMGAQTHSEVRHPYLDLRFLRFALSLPAIPWCCNKDILRRALSGELPKAILHRPKSPLAKDPNFERAKRFGLPGFPVSEALRGYIDPSRIPASGAAQILDVRSIMKAVGLAYWLDHQESGERRRTSSASTDNASTETASLCCHLYKSLN